MELRSTDASQDIRKGLGLVGMTLRPPLGKWRVPEHNLKNNHKTPLTEVGNRSAKYTASMLLKQSQVQYQRNMDFGNQRTLGWLLFSPGTINCKKLLFYILLYL